MKRTWRSAQDYADLATDRRLVIDLVRGLIEDVRLGLLTEDDAIAAIEVAVNKAP